MKTLTQNLVNNQVYRDSQINKVSVFEEFILWFALPETERNKFGIKTQSEFANKYNVRDATLSTWKKREDFRLQVRYIRDQWAFNKTGTIIQGIYAAAVKGNDRSQKLWMQLFEGFTEKTENTEIKKVEIGVNDIRFLIEALPEPLKSKHYANIRELLDDAVAVRNAGLVETNSWNERPANSILDETDNNAQDVSDSKCNVMAYRHKECVCENLERTVSENNYQSTERWGKK